MNSDVEKQDIRDGAKEEYLLSDVEAKKGCEGEEPSEEAPLKGDYGASATDSKENDANPSSAEKGGGKESRHKGLGEWLSKSRVKWWIAILLAIILMTVVLVVTLLVFEEDFDDFEDPNIVRLVKIWPQPNKPRKTISFVHGTLPYEGRVWPELITQLDDLLERYQPIQGHRSRNVEVCYGSGPSAGKVCEFDIRSVALECRNSMKYGYDKGSPCIFFEFNKIFNWQPESFTSKDLEGLPDLPDDVRYHYRPTTVFLDCQGDSLVDRENIGPVQYSPDRGFPNRYFPYRGQQEYMAPLIAVRFAKPAIGVAISVSCKFWARNINHTDEAVPSGRLDFHLLVD